MVQKACHFLCVHVCVKEVYLLVTLKSLVHLRFTVSQQGGVLLAPNKLEQHSECGLKPGW